MKLRLFFPILIAVTLGSFVAGAADISFVPATGDGDSARPGGTIEITGEITAGDAEILRDALTALERHNERFHSFIFGVDDKVRVHLDSPGGSLKEGIAMGQLLRTVPSSTSSESCASACVLIWLGGGDRFAASEGLLIHRPWFDESKSGAFENPAARTRYQSDINALRQYIVDVTGSARLFNRMMQIENRNAQALSIHEILNLSHGSDPFNEERDRRRNENRFGAENFSAFKYCEDVAHSRLERQIAAGDGRASAALRALVGQQLLAQKQCRAQLFSDSGLTDWKESFRPHSPSR